MAYPQFIVGGDIFREWRVDEVIINKRLQTSSM
jgi:hypothetical protein